MTTDAMPKGTRNSAHRRSTLGIVVVRAAPWLRNVEEVRWGAVWAGFLTTLGLFLLLTLLATGVGATVLDTTDAGAGTVSRVTGLVTAAVALVSFSSVGW